MNLPNKLTIFRILLIPIIIICLYIGTYYYNLLALVLFIVAVLTDIVDGKIARDKNLITKFGIFMDPLADKILVLSVLLMFIEFGLIPAWMVIIIIAREFIVSGIRLVSSKDIPANIWGKVKSGIQMTVVIAILILIVIQNIWLDQFAYWSMFLVAIITIISIFGYLPRVKL